MKETEMLLKTVSDGLRILAHGVKIIADKLESFAGEDGGEKAKPIKKRVPVRETPTKEAPARAPRKPKAGAGSRTKKVPSVAGKVYQVMDRMEGPVSIDVMAEKTKFNKKQIHNALFKLKKEGKVESVGKGVYRTVA